MKYQAFARKLDILRSLVKHFSTVEEKFRISARPCNILYLRKDIPLF